jgi:3-methyladenine DNA glycosylase AlkC
MMSSDVSAEEIVTEALQRTGPCCLDDLVRRLPNLSWGEVFAAVDRMSRDGRLLVRKLGCSTYQITLPSQLG